MEKAENLLPPFLCGFLALAFQILLMREFFVYFQGNEVTFGLLLACWFLWTGLGSLFANRIKYNWSRFMLFYYAAIFFFLTGLTLLRFSRFILKTLPGEIIGFIPMLLLALIITALVCFPIGMLFVLNVKKWHGRLGPVYIAEAVGSAVAGLLVYFILIPAFSNWRSAALISGLCALLLIIYPGRRRYKGFFLLLAMVLALFWTMDFSAQKIFWSPFDLKTSQDSRYAKWDIIKNNELLSFYNNTVPVFSFPDPVFAEESVHFAANQRQSAAKALLLGGGVGGCLQELLKYPELAIDYVELDPVTISLAKRFLPKEISALLLSRRVSLITQDARVFLDRAQAGYDIIILNLPDPVTAQLNRFYTLEFYSRIYNKLNKGGIFSFSVSGAENYISPERQSYLATFYFTLQKVFPNVKAIPGDRTIFLASSQPIVLDTATLQRRFASRELNNLALTPELLPFRLDQRRIKLLNQTIRQGKISINQDFKPINYFFSSVLWAVQFKGLESRLFLFLMELGSFWLLDLPLLIFLLLLLLFAALRKPSFFLLLPLFILGLTTIVLEIILINAFQVFHGYIYQSLAILLAVFMLGMAGGAYLGFKKKQPVFADLILIQSGFLLITLMTRIILQVKPASGVFYAFFGLIGTAAGYFFMIFNRHYLKYQRKYGTGYGLDLLGSFLGALVISFLLLPIFGLVQVTGYMVLMNSFTLIFLVFGRKILS